ncbi:MAG TPA: response regulator [Usitatibacter sp.]|nr:response regulator [Usitatibacter sp.]
MSNPPSSRRSLRLLLVEDSADDGELVSLALSRGGLAFTLDRVETEPDFEAALAKAPDAVLCDFHLPAFSCARALRMVHERCPGTPFIIVSRHIAESDLLSLREEGVAGFVRKNRLEDLSAAITRALSREG